MLTKLAFRNLLRNPRRTWTVIVTVGFGSASLCLFHGFNVGTMSQYREDTIHSRYGHGQVTTRGYRDQLHEKPWDHWMSHPEQIKTTLLSIPNVKNVFPRIEFAGLVSNGSVTVNGNGQAVDAEAESHFFTSLNLIEGKNLTDQPEGILLGVGLAKGLGVKVGSSVSVVTHTVRSTMNGSDFIVTGIFHTGFKDFDDYYFRIPLAKGMELLDTQSVESFALGLRSYEDWNQVSSEIKRSLPELDSTSFAVLDEVTYQNSVDWLDSQFTFIQAIILAIVVLGILNSVSTSVLERKQEIGNLRANGESANEVMSLVLIESIFLGFFGALAGITLAHVLNLTVFRQGVLMPPAPGQTRAFVTYIELQGGMAVKTICMSLIACTAGAALAAWKVVRLPIAEALRSI